jgi:hypothetical protein
MRVNFRQKLPTVLYSVMLLALVSISSLEAYQIGDAVGITIHSVTSGRNDATRAQIVTFPWFSDRFSLGFEEGFHALPWIDGKNLGKLRVTFIYSKSGGDGAIHSVSSEPIMQSKDQESSNRQIEIEYQWKEEERGDIQSGASAMFLATLVVSVIFLLQACGLTESDASTCSEDHLSEMSNPSSSKRGTAWRIVSRFRRSDI